MTDITNSEYLAELNEIAEGIFDAIRRVDVAIHSVKTGQDIAARTDLDKAIAIMDRKKQRLIWLKDRGE